MTTKDSLNCEKLRAAFEGREALYIEQGVLRVRVTNIRCDVAAHQINAEVEEIITPGLEQGLIHDRVDQSSPIRWKISAGFLTSFSADSWEMGYGGWSLDFAPEIISRLMTLAAGWPAELSAYERYCQAMDILNHRHGHAPSLKVFSDERQTSDGRARPAPNQAASPPEGAT